MRLTIIESPFAGTSKWWIINRLQRWRNIRYARICLRDSLNLGEAPIAYHLLYPQVLDDNDESQRQWGIEAGLAWRRAAQVSVFYADYGFSRGMNAAMKTALLEGKQTMIRKLYS